MSFKKFLLVFVSAVFMTTVSRAAENSDDDTSDSSPNEVGIKFSADNQGDSTSLVTGDIFFDQNFHFGISGGSSKAKNDDATAGEDTTVTSKNFGVVIGSDSDRFFSGAATFDYFGLTNVLTESTIKIPLTFKPNNWTLAIIPGHGTINFDRKAAKSRTVDVEIGDSSIGGSVTYKGLKNWRFELMADTHSFSKDLRKVDTTAGQFLISRGTLSLAQQINDNSQQLSIIYSFKKIDLGLEGSRAESALDGSVSRTGGITIEWFINDNMSLPIEISSTTTDGDDPTTGTPYPKTKTVSVGFNYIFN